MENKVKLILRENVMLFQTKRVELISSLLALEGFHISQDSVKSVYDKTILQMIDINEVNAVLNLKEGCREIIQNLRSDITLDMLTSLNKEISRDDSFDWGVLRNSRLFIEGTSYLPEVPNKDDVELNLSKILETENSTQRALNLLCYLLKSQLYWGRNLSLAIIVANKIMIENGCGIIMVKSDFMDEFKSNYLAFLESDDNRESFINFIYENCIDIQRVDHI